MAACHGAYSRDAMRAFVGVAALLIGLAPLAWGQEMSDATVLLDYCDHHPADTEENVPAALSLALCYGFLKGVGDAHAMAAEASGTPRPYCLPAPALTNEQARLVFLDWAGKHPERLNLSPARAVTAALSETFPCYE